MTECPFENFPYIITWCGYRAFHPSIYHIPQICRHYGALAVVFDLKWSESSTLLRRWHSLLRLPLPEFETWSQVPGSVA